MPSLTFILAYALLSCSVGPARAHISRNCGFHDRSEEQAEQEEINLSSVLQRRYGNAKASRSRNLTVDVHFHSIEDSSGNGAVSDATIDEQIDVLNNAFADGGWTFVLASKSVTVSDDWFVISDANEQYIKRSLRQGKSADLNIYTGALEGSLLGWASFPASYENNPVNDGVVCHYESLPGGGFDDYNEGDTGTHEVGHWLGLYHTFQDGCSGKGDRVSDTPAVRQPHSGCPGPVDTCPNDGLGNDMTWNYMDYVDDPCMTAFSPGQFKRMKNMWYAYRYVNEDCDSANDDCGGGRGEDDQETTPAGGVAGFFASTINTIIFAVVFVVVVSVLGFVGFYLWRDTKPPSPTVNTGGERSLSPEVELQVEPAGYTASSL